MKYHLNVKSILMLVATVALATGCMEQTLEKDEVISVAHYPVISGNDAENATLNLKVQFSHQTGTDEWSEIPLDNIEGFAYELGNNYQLQIHKEEVYDEEKEQYFVQYTMLSELEKEPVSANTTFEIPLKSTDFSPSKLVYGDEELGYTVLGEIHIDCGTFCESLPASLETQSNVTGVFRHEDNNTIELVQLK